MIDVKELLNISLIVLVLFGPVGLAVGAFYWFRYAFRNLLHRDISLIHKVVKGTLLWVFPLFLYFILISLSAIPYIDGMWTFFGEVEHMPKHIDFLNTMAYFTLITLPFPVGYTVTAVVLILFTLLQKPIATTQS